MDRVCSAPVDVLVASGSLQPAGRSRAAATTKSWQEMTKAGVSSRRRAPRGWPRGHRPSAASLRLRQKEPLAKRSGTSNLAVGQYVTSAHVSPTSPQGHRRRRPARAWTRRPPPQALARPSASQRHRGWRLFSRPKRYCCVTRVVVLVTHRQQVAIRCTVPGRVCAMMSFFHSLSRCTWRARFVLRVRLSHSLSSPPSVFGTTFQDSPR